MRTRFQQDGDKEAIEQAHAMLDEVQHLSLGDRERLFGYLEGTGKMILAEPGALLTEASKMPGLDGQKMSKSYNNTITLREDAASVTHKLRRMPTDPAPMRERAQVYLDDPMLVKSIIADGCEKARELARETMRDVRESMGLEYH